MVDFDVAPELDVIPVTRWAVAVKILCPCPSAALHPNSRGGWRGKWPKVKQQRTLCADAGILATCQREWEPLDEAGVCLHYRFGRSAKGGRRQRHDPDNLIAWSKSTIDGLCDAKVFANDRQLIYFPPTQCFTDGLGDWLLVAVYKKTPRLDGEDQDAGLRAER